MGMQDPLRDGQADAGTTIGGLAPPDVSCQQVIDVGPVDSWTTVVDGDAHRARRGVPGDVDATVGGCVAQRVVEHVLDGSDDEVFVSVYEAFAV